MKYLLLIFLLVGCSDDNREFIFPYTGWACDNGWEVIIENQPTDYKDPTLEEHQAFCKHFNGMKVYISKSNKKILFTGKQEINKDINP